LKTKLKGIRFNTWLYFSALAVVVLTLFGIMLNVLIKPYYRNDRIERMNNIVSLLQEDLMKDKHSQADADEISALLANSSVCAYVFNEQGQQLLYVDTLGQNCALNGDIAYEGESFNLNSDNQEAIGLLKEKENISFSLANSSDNSETLIYGKMIRANLVNYYFFINTPLEPVESIVDFIMSQYLYIALIVLLIAFVISFALSHRISEPIIKMKQEANKLAEQDYDLDLPEDSFAEIDELATSLESASNKLSKVNELRKDLLANVSHDIKTPLTMIKAYAEMIRDISGNDEAKRNEHIEVILKESDYLNRLVSDMQELSKMQAGYIELSCSNCDLKEISLDVLELLDLALKEKNLKIISKLDNALVYGDELKLTQVVYNFLTNAIKHSHNGDTIEITLENREKSVYFAVKDQGEGIAQEDLEKIWDRYYKIDKGFHRSIESTGLGLAIVRLILEAHKAKYGVQSELGEGALFYFEIFKDYD